MHTFVKVMKALSDPNRVKILKLLQQREMCICEIHALLDIAQPTISKNLKALDNAGLVSRRKKGLWVYCRLSDGRDTPYAASLLGNLRHWLDDDPAVRELCAKSELLNMEDLCAGASPEDACRTRR
jgi:ArsR family transcriptional regulator